MGGDGSHANDRGPFNKVFHLLQVIWIDAEIMQEFAVIEARHTGITVQPSSPLTRGKFLDPSH